MFSWPDLSKLYINYSCSGLDEANEPILIMYGKKSHFGVRVDGDGEDLGAASGHCGGCGK